MNFDNNAPVDVLIGQLLAFVVMFEKKLEHIKCRMAGNEQFHTRVAFQNLDINKKNEISAQALNNVFHSYFSIEQEKECELFLRRYSKNGAMTYDQFLKLVTPKSNKTLAQRMMIRTYPKGATLEDYLNRYLLDLLALYIKMTTVTENIRTTIQQNQELTQLDLIEFFRQRIGSNDNLFYFLQKCTERGQQYDIIPSDGTYLSYHITSGNDLEDFTEIDIKEVLCPLDLNSYQKRVTKQIFYQHQRTSFPKQIKSNTQSTNFLGKTYQKLYERPKNSQLKKQNKAQFILKPDRYTMVNTNRQQSIIEKSSYMDHAYGNLYIDNFARSENNSNLQLNYLLGNNVSGRPQPQFQHFQDQLNSNGSSVSRQESAFDRS